MGLLFFSCGSSEAEKVDSAMTEMVHHDMDWILGTWIGGVASEGLESKEVWTKVSEDRYAGDAEMRQNGEVVSTEHMEILVQDGHHCLIVDHDASESVIFEFTAETWTGFVCRNSENDFPKQIEYKREGEELVAVISEGGPRIEFRFERTE